MLAADPIRLTVAYRRWLQRQNGGAAEQSRVGHCKLRLGRRNGEWIGFGALHGLKAPRRLERHGHYGGDAMAQQQ
jgi:hypothetical protein